MQWTEKVIHAHNRGDYCSMHRLRDLSTRLEQMGSNADEVAATLRANNVQGTRNTVRVLNPIVRYIQNTLLLDNLEADVIVSTLCIHSSGGTQVCLPQAVLDFLDAFNRGAH